jgi:hypothetical protein
MAVLFSRIRPFFSTIHWVHLLLSFLPPSMSLSISSVFGAGAYWGKPFLPLALGALVAPSTTGHSQAQLPGQSLDEVNDPSDKLNAEKSDPSHDAKAPTEGDQFSEYRRIGQSIIKSMVVSDKSLLIASGTGTGKSTTEQYFLQQFVSSIPSSVVLAKCRPHQRLLVPTLPSHQTADLPAALYRPKAAASLENTVPVEAGSGSCHLPSERAQHICRFLPLLVDQTASQCDHQTLGAYRGASGLNNQSLPVRSRASP